MNEHQQLLIGLAAFLCFAGQLASQPSRALREQAYHDGMAAGRAVVTEAGEYKELLARGYSETLEKGKTPLDRQQLTMEFDRGFQHGIMAWVEPVQLPGSASPPPAVERSSVWIEAEDESTSHVLPAGQRPAPNAEEQNPSWRPPYFGTGCWYLAVEGESLSYAFSLPVEGPYTVWIRDFADAAHPPETRSIRLFLDDRECGIFPAAREQAAGNGVFRWHRVLDGIPLTAGSHQMRLEKHATTPAAAILDAIYLTSDPQDSPPEK